MLQSLMGEASTSYSCNTHLSTSYRISSILHCICSGSPFHIRYLIYCIFWLPLVFSGTSKWHSRRIRFRNRSHMSTTHHRTWMSFYLLILPFLHLLNKVSQCDCKLRAVSTHTCTKTCAGHSIPQRISHRMSM